MAVTIEEFVAELGWEIDPRGLKQFGKQIDGVKADLRALAKYGAIATAALGYGFKKVMGAFSMIEDSTAAFQPVLGSLDKAAELVQMLNDTAADTPYQFDAISKAAKQLIPNMEGDLKGTIDTFRMLGDTAGGNTQKLDSIVRGFTKAQLKGKVDMESLNMIAEAGVPIIKALAKSMGHVTGPKFFKLISSGKVGVEDLTNAFKDMTSEGGMFYRGMEIASRTLTGRMSTLRDNVTGAAADFGDGLAPSVKEVVEEMLVGVKGVRAWIKANKDLIRTEGAKWIRGFADAAKSAYDYLRRLDSFVRSIGGWKSTIQRIGLAFVSWKLGSMVTSLGSIVGSLTKIKGLSLVSALGGSVINSLETVGLLAAIPLLIEDIMVSLEGGKGLFYEEADAIAKATMEMNGFVAAMLGISLDEFNLSMVQGINDIGNAWESADKAFHTFLNSIAEGLFQAIISVDRFGDSIVNAARNIFSRATSALIGRAAPSNSAFISGPQRMMAPSSNVVSSVTNDNRTYRIAPSASITQGSTDLRQAQRELGKTMERQWTEALGTIG